ncbi:MAG TPA: DUF255 domain-containing protein [Thermoanaerobaculia bacterium]|nr:DUF255 domain-containing protein [Thermoanaerobaculia bacterium]
MSETSGRKNRLAQESSPYLLLHQSNPVDWYPWGEEAIARARAEDKPIFLSVGYSTCYWCHVMERESFSDPEIAALMNKTFINVKVDREERPDLDEVYMAATQLLTGQGGWPNSVFLTPDLEPFYAGTYFPPRERYGRPGFGSLVIALGDAWKNRRSQIETQAEEVTGALGRHLEERLPPSDKLPGQGVADAALASLSRRFDREWGGFSQAPKFPTPSNLLLLHELAGENPEAAAMLATTLDRMARGGLFDHLGGGFHRYATDREWRVPHFEKMLYDNGLLLEVYALEHARTGDPELARVARETVTFLLAELAAPEGGFRSAIDAETNGKEGAYYVWARAELEAALGPEDAAFLAPLLGFAGPPFFEDHHYVLHLPLPLADLATARRMGREQLLAEMLPALARLKAVRDGRPRPLVDDKVLADWNGMAIAGLARAGRVLGEPAWVARAAAGARFVLSALRPAGGPLHHTWRQGQARREAFLSDYVHVVHALLVLAECEGSPEWLAKARELTDEQIRRLADPEGGFYTAAASRDLLFRTREVFDGATPAANALAVLNLIELAQRTGEASYRERAERALRAFGLLLERFPEGSRMLALAARRYARAFGGEATPVAAAAPVSALEEEARRVVSASLEWGGVDGGDGIGFRLRLTVAPGWHVQANPASADFLIPTRLEAAAGRLEGVTYPLGEAVRLAIGAEGAVQVYRGELTLTGRLIATGSGRPVLSLTYQPCDEGRCLPPVTSSWPAPE